MARLMFAVFAERVTVDRFSNALDLHNVIELLQIPEPPADVQTKARKAKQHLAARGRLALLIHWRRTMASTAEGTLKQRVQLFGPKGVLLATAEQDFSLREFQYSRNLVGFEGLPIAGEGTYTARISLKSGKRWRAMGEAAFELQYLRAHPAATDKRRLH
jgi:hypothetical protein